MPLCPRCGEDNPERFRLCGFCGAPLAEAKPTRRKLVTVLFCDMTGSTSLGERLDAESMQELMSRYFQDMRGAIEGHGGTVEKFIGDAVMAVFGVPVSHEDDPLRAVRAAAEMQERLAALNVELGQRFGRGIAVRIGVNTGEVVAGDHSTAQTIVTGDAVNVAARLEQAAAPGTTLLGEQTYRLTRDSVVVEPVEPLRLKGKAEPVAAYRLRSVNAAQAVTRGRLSVEMVGRKHERAELEAAFAQCIRERRCRLVTVVAEAGVGKSRLAAEFTEGVASQATVLKGRCRSYGEAITYWPLAEAVRQAAGIRDDDSGEKARERLAALLSEQRDAGHVVELISTAIGLGETAASAEEISSAARKLLEAVGRVRPVVFLIDDLHWAEPVFLDLVEGIVQSNAAPIMLLCLARPALLERRPAFGESRQDRVTVRLDALGEGDSTHLVEAMLGGARLSDEVSARVVASAAGNPLFIEELLGMLIDEGLISRDKGTWRATGNLSRISIPPTLDGLLSSRLDGLGDEERETIERASVEGQVFHRGAVEALSPAPARSEILAALEALTDKEFIHRDAARLSEDVAFRFRHILIRDTAYRSIAKKARAELHEQFARWLEDKAGARAREYEEVIGLHFEQAHHYRAELGPLDESARVLAQLAAERLGRAGRRALLSRGDVPAALNLLDRASSLPMDDEPARLRLRIDLAFALTQAGDLGRADEVLSEAGERAAALGERHLALEARVDRGFFRLQVDQEVDAYEEVRLAEEAIPVFEQVGDELALAKAWRLLGYTRALRWGQWTAANEALGRALAHAARGGSKNMEGTVRHILGISLVYGPTPLAAAIERMEGVLGAIGESPQAEAGVMVCLGRLYASDGRFEAARELVERGRAQFEQLGHALLSTSVLLQRGDVELLAGDYHAAERELRSAYAAMERIGDQAWIALVTARLAKALYGVGRYEEAARFLDLCDKAAATDQAWPRVVMPATRAKLLARECRMEEAETAAREAVALAEQTDALELHGDALLDLAEVLRLADAPPKRIASALEEALALYERKGNRPSAERARALLEALGSDEYLHAHG